MKRSLLALLTALLFITGCGNDAPGEDIDMAPEVSKDSLSTIKGDFIYLADAAVLKGKDFIYGVEIDSVSRKLADSIAPLKRDEFHMIPVVVKGKIIQNPGQEGWEEVVLIREILEIPQAIDTAAPQVKQDLDKP